MTFYFMVEFEVNSGIQVPLLLWYGVNFFFSFFLLVWGFLGFLLCVFCVLFLEISGWYVLDNKYMLCFPQFPGSLIRQEHKCCETSMMEQGLSKFLARINSVFRSLVLLWAKLRSVYVVNTSSIWLMASNISIGISILIRNCKLSMLAVILIIYCLWKTYN